MKKLIIVLLSLVMVVSLSACSGGSEAEPEEGSEQTVAESVFTGNYVVSADYVKENLDNILLYDARGEEAAAEGTIAQAVPVAWQYFATCEDGATGDANWGCILDPERLSARLGEKGFDKDKEIVIFAAADQGWGDDTRFFPDAFHPLSSMFSFRYSSICVLVGIEVIAPFLCTQMHPETLP